MVALSPQRARWRCGLAALGCLVALSVAAGCSPPEDGPDPASRSSRGNAGAADAAAAAGASAPASNSAATGSDASEPTAGSTADSTTGDRAASKRPSAKPTLVEVVRPTRGVIRDQLTLSGDLRAENWIDITSRVSEEVVRVAVREGDLVERGGVLVELNDRELRFTAREREQSHLEALARQRTAELEKVEAGQNEALRGLALEKATKEFARFEELASTGKNRALTQEEYEGKRYALEEARLAEATARVAREKAEVAHQLSTIAVEQAKLAWDRALLDLSRTQICSPIDGAVAFLEVRPGEMVQTGALVASVVNRRSLYCEVRVPQRNLPALREGQSVQLSAETYPERQFAGRLDVIHPNVDPEQGTVKVRISVADTEAVLRPGIYITAQIDLAVHDHALLVPKRARLFEGQDSVIFVVRDDRAVRLVIPVGLQTAEQVEVLADSVPDPLSRLTDGDQVIVRGHTHLLPGASVEIYTEPAGATPAGAAGPAAASATNPEEA
ncbi:MAG: efflux RND transporter periplasmic adaptor subunit [Planctomycetota bacterium]